MQHAQHVTEECHIISQSTQSTTARLSLLVGAVVFAATIVLDQISKWIVLETLGPDGSRDAVTIIPGVLQFIFVRNTGAAFGMFRGNSEILRILAIGAVLALLIYYVRAAKRDWVLSVALGLQLGGALGNIIDRFIHGYVVDWIDVPRFPTFNLADSAITVGVVLLMYALLFRDNHAADPEHHVQRTERARAAGDDA